MEEWRDVVDYEEYFMVSSHGRIFSKRSNKILKQHSNKRGVMSFSTRLNGRIGNAICLKIHRLVAFAFLPLIDGKDQVNHIDGNPSNNHVDNLEWCTGSENCKHAVATGLKTNLYSGGSSNIKAKLKYDDVKNIRELYKTGYYTHRILGEMYNVSNSTISDIVNIVSWKHIE